jgi:hypothetical protein
MVDNTLLKNHETGSRETLTSIKLTKETENLNLKGDSLEHPTEYYDDDDADSPQTSKM